MSFITQDDYYDLPIPLLPDYILSFREIIPCSYSLDRESSLAYKTYCESILEVVNEVERNPQKLSIQYRTNLLFFRGNALYSYHILDFLSKITPDNKEFYDFQIIRPKGLVESTEDGLKCIMDNRFSRYYIKEE